MIPDLDANGMLPPGVWDCSFAEIEGRFCWNDHRRALWLGLKRFLKDVYQPMGVDFPIWIDGSFCRNKQVPSDIDIVLDLAEFDGAAAFTAAWKVRAQHDAIKATYHVDLWVRHPKIPHDVAAFFQYVGDKAAAELRLQPKDPKGILRVFP